MAMDAAEAVRGIADFPAGAGRFDMATGWCERREYEGDYGQWLEVSRGVVDIN
jgi:hypothetical protein